MPLTWNQIINLNWKNQPFIKIGGKNTQQVFAAMGNDYQQVRFVLYPTHVDFEITGQTHNIPAVRNFCLNNGWTPYTRHFGYRYQDNPHFDNQAQIVALFERMKNEFPGGLNKLKDILAQNARNV